MPRLERFRHDLLYAVRSLRRAPGLTAAAIVTLALAIGAGRWRVLSYVLGRGSRLVVASAISGIAAALVTTRLMTTLLHEVEPLDPWTFALASALLVTVGLVACAIPAFRATRIDPAMAMRE